MQSELRAMLETARVTLIGPPGTHALIASRPRGWRLIVAVLAFWWWRVARVFRREVR